MGIIERYLAQFNNEKRRSVRSAMVLTTLSVFVIIGVSWNLRMTAVTIANGAGCGQQEHQHTEECITQGELICGYIDEQESEPESEDTQHIHTDECYQYIYQCEVEEHIHNLSCYSDLKADVETPLQWQEMFAGYPYTGDLHKDLVYVAKTQVGYTESSLNFMVGDNEERYGYTRYGDWYGAPYNEWSAMFVSFCLSYAQADLTEYPVNSGANTMANLWNEQGKYVSAGQYLPVSGDLVFFKNNTAGIVSEVQNATICVIAGDVDDAVCARSISVNDGSIAGWGIIGKPLSEETLQDESSVMESPEEIQNKEDLQEDIQDTDEQQENSNDVNALNDQLLDISNGPAVFIFTGDEPVQQISGFALRSTRIITDLLTYLQANNGTYFLTLLDTNNTEVPKDAQGNYVVEANKEYKLSISFNSPDGFKPGTYQYQTPNGLLVVGGDGTFKLNDGTYVGTWVVTDTGLITLDFNENISSHTDITISVALGINFVAQDNPIDFDGKITVTVEKPPQQQYPTGVLKWGQQSAEDEDKIYWTVQITGNLDSQIPDNIVTDQAYKGEWSQNHKYTESDIAAGLTIGVSEPDPVTGQFKDWHSWHVSPDDPHLIWTETGWSYKMPKTAVCQWCGEVELGNANWVYTINYTSTPDRIGTPGTYGYENKVTMDGQTAYAWADFTQGETTGELVKNGKFIADAGGGNFMWEIQVTIPGRANGQKADYGWYIMDYMYLMNSDGVHEKPLHNDADKSIVTATYNGTSVRVPTVQQATADDQFAWHNAWTATQDGVGHGQEIFLLCRCHCDADNCRYWNNGCSGYWYEDYDGEWKTNGFCQCWTEQNEVVLTFIYNTDVVGLSETYGGFGYQVHNFAELFVVPPGATTGAKADDGDDIIPIPNLFQKQLTHDFNGYTAHYQITVNEAKAVLTDGRPLVISDSMTDTLSYISGSLIITTEDVDGRLSTLQQDIDYTVKYNGAGGQTDQQGNKVHVLEIEIMKPKPVKYILDYDTTLIMPEHLTGAIKYTNSASITLWDKMITSDTPEKVHAEINLSTKSFALELQKTCAVTSLPLPGAVIGIYNEYGGLIDKGTTGTNGQILFKTNTAKGIILREHQPYYLQEIEAPTAYMLDKTQNWIVFCSNSEEYCATCEDIYHRLNSTRIPLDQIGKINMVNHPYYYELPATGGIGIIPYMLCGMILVSIPLVYILSLRRKHERRLRK